jgi:hypothetical protein
MKKIMLVLAFLFTFNLINTDTFAIKHVKGYFKSNGTYVAPYYRTDPDGFKYNNWSTKGNYNPYSGKWGNRW